MIWGEYDGYIFGLEDDLKLVGNSQDKFEQTLANLIIDGFGPQYSRFIKTKYANINGKKICVLNVDKTPEPVFLKGPKGKEFYIRIRTTSRALDPQDTVDYIQNNWQ